MYDLAVLWDHGCSSGDVNVAAPALGASCSGLLVEAWSNCKFYSICFVCQFR